MSAAGFSDARILPEFFVSQLQSLCVKTNADTRNTCRLGKLHVSALKYKNFCSHSFTGNLQIKKIALKKSFPSILSARQSNNLSSKEFP